VGVEADIDWTGINRDETFVSVANPVTGIPRTVMGSRSLDWLSTFRARVGWTPADRWLIYVTGGGAAGSAKVSASFTTNDIGGVLGNGCIVGTCESNSSSSTLWGWSAGGGVEVAVATFRSEASICTTTWATPVSQRRIRGSLPAPTPPRYRPRSR
jgi:outer membrane immunogenic protein